jgi:PST family polysaccharide transporter
LALLGRTFQQNKMVAADIAGLAVYIVTAIGLAASGAGPWSIAVGRVGGSAVAAVLLLIFSPSLPRPGFNRVQARKLVKFGVPLTTAALVAEGVMNADYLVVGKTLGTVTLGVYLLAFNLSTWPVSAVMVSVGRVAFPAFARLAEDRDRMKRAYTRGIGILATGIFPIVALLASLSTNVIQFVYGGVWLPASTPLRFLLVLAIGRVTIQTTLEFLAADGAAGTILRIQTAWLVVLVPALIVGATNYGIAGVGVAHMAVVLLWVLPLLGSTLHRRGVELRPVAAGFIRPVIGAAGAIVTVTAVEHFVAGSFLQLVIAGAAGLAVYLALVIPHNELVEWGWQQARRRKPAELASV